MLTHSVCFLQNAKPFPSSDSLAKVQEVASWLLEMNQDLLSGGSSSRRSRGLGGQAVRGNASSTTRAPQQAAEDDEDDHVNRVVEEEELRQRVRPRQTQPHKEGQTLSHENVVCFFSPSSSLVPISRRRCWLTASGRSRGRLASPEPATALRVRGRRGRRAKEGR